MTAGAGLGRESYRVEPARTGFEGNARLPTLTVRGRCGHEQPRTSGVTAASVTSSVTNADLNEQKSHVTQSGFVALVSDRNLLRINR
jgi:hypothetical protein